MNKEISCVSMSMPAELEISYVRELQFVCRIAHTQVFALLILTYIPIHRVIELVSFDEWLANLQTQENLAEEMAQIILEKVCDSLVEFRKVEVTLVAKSENHSPVSVFCSVPRAKSYRTVSAASILATARISHYSNSD